MPQIQIEINRKLFLRLKSHSQTVALQSNTEFIIDDEQVANAFVAEIVESIKNKEPNIIMTI